MGGHAPPRRRHPLKHFADTGRSTFDLIVTAIWARLVLPLPPGIIETVLTRCISMTGALNL